MQTDQTKSRKNKIQNIHCKSRHCNQKIINTSTLSHPNQSYPTRRVLRMPIINYKNILLKNLGLAFTIGHCVINYCFTMIFCTALDIKSCKKYNLIHTTNWYNFCSIISIFRITINHICRIFLCLNCCKLDHRNYSIFWKHLRINPNAN